MTLTLVWNAYRNYRPFRHQEMSFEHNGTIGRANDNDFIVEDPEKYASRYHAKVYRAHGTWYIEDMSTGGTLITRSNEDELELNHSAKTLKDGDILTIGDCELLVQISQPTVSYSSQPSADMSPGPSMGGDFFDIRDFDFGEEEPLYEKPESVQEIPRPNLVYSGANEYIAPAEIQDLPNSDDGSVDAANSENVSKYQAQASIPKAKPTTDSAKNRAAPADTEDNADHLAIKAFLSELNIAPKALVGQNKTEVMREAGILLRTLTESMMEVLRARASVKSTYAMDVTQVRRSRNNALKFSVTATEAMAKMLTRESGYKDPIESAEEAVKDVKAHNLALANGLMVAIDTTIEAFAPQELEARFHENVNKILPKSAQYWRLYRDNYVEVAEDIKDNMQSANSQFAKAFREVYEAQSQAIGSDDKE